MKKIINNIVISISYLIVCFGLVIDFNKNLNMTGIEKVVIYITPMLILFMNMIIQMKMSKDDKEKEKIKNQMLGCIFIIYIISLATLLFLGSEYRYIPTLEQWFKRDRFNTVNLIPFKTVLDYMLNRSYSISAIMINIGGNLLAFTPMGFFIPVLFNDKFKSLKQFVLLMIGIVFCVELLQFVLNVGCADIDDILLNTLGAVIVYKLMQTNPIKKVLEKVFK